MRRALVYCTVNGVCNNTNGLGRQTKTLLSTLNEHRDELTHQTGPFDVHLVCPAPGPATWGYDPADLAYAERVAAAWGGAVHPLNYDTAGDFWSLPTWRTLCARASEVVGGLACRYDELLVVAVDTPFAGLGAALTAMPVAGARVGTVLVFYSTALIVERPTPDPARVAWERAGIESANTLPDVLVGDVGRYLTGHLRGDYGLDERRLVPFISSLNLTSPDLIPMPEPHARDVAARWNIPLDRPILLTIGRTDPTKGVDVFLDAVRPLREDVHVVAIAVPLPGRGSLLDDYRRQMTAHGLRATLVDQFSRELPQALCSLPATQVVACPSRGETLANVPFEVALWARDGGPVVVAPRRDGFIEQITDRLTGLLYDPDDPGGLTEAIRAGIALDEPDRTSWRAAAHARVYAERDALKNLAATLRAIWGAPLGC